MQNKVAKFIKLVIVKFSDNEKCHLVMIFEVLEEMPNSGQDCLFKNVLEHFLKQMLYGNFSTKLGVSRQNLAFLDKTWRFST